MSDKNNRNTENRAQKTGTMQRKFSDIKTSETPFTVITSRPTSSMVIIVCVAILMISLNTLKYVGWILLVLMMFSFAFGKNNKQFSFYKTFMLIHALDDEDLCWKIDYASIGKWKLKRSWATMSTLSIETMGQYGQHIETRCWNYHALQEALLQAVPDKKEKAAANSVGSK